MATTRYLHLLLLSVAGLTSSTVVISEVADKGSSGQCGANNEDWVELHNTGSGSVSLVGWKLHDDKGPSHSKAFTFPSTTSLAAGEYLVLCTRMGNATTSPQFKISGDDTITLLDASGAVVSSTGALQDLGKFGLVWAYDAASTSPSWHYTSTPTPGQANVFTNSWPAVHCGGLRVDNLTIQWAKTPTAFNAALASLRELGAPVEVRRAPGLPGRWRVMRKLIASTARAGERTTDSLLDVGGFGEYRRSARNARCINLSPHTGCDVYPAGAPLPYDARSFETVLLETVLHHAAEHALQLLGEVARVARRYVIIAEDVLYRRATIDVVESYRAHDPWAVYRSTEEWVALARNHGLRLWRIVALDRVPIHIARDARPGCTLDFPPMQYYVFRKL